MSEQQHTPTPWKLEHGTGGPGDGRPFVEIVGAPAEPRDLGFVVVRVFIGDHRPEELIAQDLTNLALIVRAVNSHEALVQAVCDADVLIGDLYPFVSEEIGLKLDKSHAQFRAALDTALPESKPAEPAVVFEPTEDTNAWPEHAELTFSDWQAEAGQGNTRLGYEDWVRHQIEIAHDEERQVANG